MPTNNKPRGLASPSRQVLNQRAERQNNKMLKSMTATNSRLCIWLLLSLPSDLRSFTMESMSIGEARKANTRSTLQHVPRRF